MDAPSQFFFELERRNGQRKIIHSLQSSNGFLVSDSAEISRLTVSFYRDLYKSELTDSPHLHTFFSGLPQVNVDANAKLGSVLPCCQKKGICKS